MEKGFNISLDNVTIRFFSCLPVGRAKNCLNQKDFIKEPILSSICPSIGREITVYPTGEVTPCCSPMLTPDKFSLGNIYMQSLEDILTNCGNNRNIVNLYKYGISCALNKKGSLCEFCSDTNAIN